MGAVSAGLKLTGDRCEPGGLIDSMKTRNRKVAEPWNVIVSEWCREDAEVKQPLENLLMSVVLSEEAVQGAI